MAETTIVFNNEEVVTQVKSTYQELLTETIKNEFYSKTLANITAAVDNLAISEEKKAESLI